MNFNNFNTTIIITSDEPWGDVWHTQLHYAYELSKLFNVIYINPPVKGIKKMLKSKIKPIDINNNLRIVNYIRLVPLKFGRLSILINDFITSVLIKFNLPSYNNIILWRIDHFRLHHLFFIKVKYSIYHVIDHWIEFPEDKMLAQSSDMVIYTSPRLANHYVGLSKRHINIPQGISEEEFITDKNIIDNLKLKYGKYMFSCSTFSDSVDIEILLAVAREFSNINLVLAGPVIFEKKENIYLFNKLINMENVYYLGILSGKELKNYIAAAVICLIHYPFSLQSKFLVRSPHKILNYLAQCKPVVTSFKCEIESLEDNVIFYASNLNDYINYIHKILTKELSFNQSEIYAYLNDVKYENLINKIFIKLLKKDDET
jgi:hypothetical protein